MFYFENIQDSDIAKVLKSTEAAAVPVVTNSGRISGGIKRNGRESPLFSIWLHRPPPTCGPPRRRECKAHYGKIYGKGVP